MQKPKYTCPEDYSGLEQPEELDSDVVMSKLETLLADSGMREAGINLSSITTTLLNSFHFSFFYEINGIVSPGVEVLGADENTEKTIRKFYNRLIDYAANLARLVRIYDFENNKADGIIASACQVFGVNPADYMDAREKIEGDLLKVFEEKEGNLSVLVKLPETTIKSASAYRRHWLPNSENPITNN